MQTLCPKLLNLGQPFRRSGDLARLAGQPLHIGKVVAKVEVHEISSCNQAHAVALQ